MCDDCFLSEVEQFQNPESWNTFELTLMRKVDQGTMNKVKQDDGTDSVYIYACVACKENWVLQPPVNGKGGSFLTLSTILKKLAVPAWRRRLRIVVLVLIVIVVILELLAW
jgi:hypothetical protein